MDLVLKDVADLLNINEEEIEFFAAEGKIPSYIFQGEFRFNRVEIEQWLLEDQNEKESSLKTHTPKVPLKREGGLKSFSLYRAIHKGGVLYDVPYTTKEDILKCAASHISPLLEIDAHILYEYLLDRENLQPTALNRGFAVPHTRDLFLKHSLDIVTLMTLKTPIEWGALDGQKVHSLFFLLASHDKGHLHLLAKIAHLSQTPSFSPLLEKATPKEELLSFIKEWEGNIKTN